MTISAEKGYFPAQIVLSAYYRKGVGVKKSFQISDEWLKKCLHNPQPDKPRYHDAWTLLLNMECAPTDKTTTGELFEKTLRNGN